MKSLVQQTIFAGSENKSNLLSDVESIDKTHTLEEFGSRYESSSTLSAKSWKKDNTSVEPDVIVQEETNEIIVMSKDMVEEQSLTKDVEIRGSEDVILVDTEMGTTNDAIVKEIVPPYEDLMTTATQKRAKSKQKHKRKSKKKKGDGILMESLPLNKENFEAVANELLSGDNVIQGYTFYDLISRSLHQLARDGNDELLALAIDRLGDQAYKRINQLDDAKLAPLHYAARYSHPNIIRTLLQKKAEVNILGQYNLTPLHLAARYRLPMKSALRRKQRKKRVIETDVSEQDGLKVEELDEEIDTSTLTVEESDDLLSLTSASEYPEGSPESVVKLLVDNGARINARDIYQLTPLHYAAMRGNDIAAQDLLSYIDILDIEAQDIQQMTPLFIAVMYGYVEICKLLLENGCEYLTPDEAGQTPLHKAAAEGNKEICEQLLRVAEDKQEYVGSIRKMLSFRDAEKQTPLHVSVTNGHLECSRLLLSRGADVNCIRDTLATPLHAAATVGDTHLIELLIEFGAVVDAVDSNRQTPLHRAASNNKPDAIEILLDNKAQIEKRDSDSFTPLLVAASFGHAESIKVLLERGANIEFMDKQDKTIVYLCAENNHVEALKTILEYPGCREMVDNSDRYDNSPLHKAAMRGHLAVIQELIKTGSQIDNKNEDAETALHIAAEKGHLNVVNELIKHNRFLVNDENEDAETPLHLASSQGRKSVVERLLHAGADIEARNTSLWTPLDAASANGHADVCAVLIDNNSPIDPLDRTKNTPLQLAAKAGHVPVIELLLSRGASVNIVDASDRNALEIAIAMGHRNAAMAIIKSENWMDALTHSRENKSNPEKKITPFRMLIKRYPDVAEAVLDRCTTTNGLDSEDEKFGIKFNFHFIDDTYIVPDYVEEYAQQKNNYNVPSAYSSDNQLAEYAEPYTYNTRVLRTNHPLSLMVKFKRSGLLGHPVVIALVRHKWDSYARYVYYFNLLCYCIFLGALTGYVINSGDRSHISWLLRNTTAAVPETCEEIQSQLGLQMSSDLLICKWIIIAMVILNIIREVFQFYQARLNYLGLENLLDWLCYVGAFVLVWDWTEGPSCFIRERWQWEVGAVAIFIAWMNLVLYIRRLPFFGIYVVMFVDILRTFSKFFLVFFLFIVAFALGFFMLLKRQGPFTGVGRSLLKTTVMMIGEFEYDSIFESDHEDVLPYPEMTYILFVVFIIVMSVLIMNLLVGLAVDDIKAVQDQAILKRLAMQAETVMEVEVVMPEALRRYFSREFSIVRPNKRKGKFARLLGEFSHFDELGPQNIEHVQRDEKENLNRSVDLLHTEMESLKMQNQRLHFMLTSLLAVKSTSGNKDE